jgi:drug/metabolite transporter (DMT)-like permease
MEIRRYANMYLVLGIALAALWPVALGLVTSMNIYEFMFAEYALAVPASLAFVVLSKKWHSMLAMARSKSIGVLALISVLNYGFADFGMLYAEHYIAASLAAVVFRVYPLLMLLFIPFILKERVSKYQAIALGLGVLGIYFGLTNGTASLSLASMPAMLLVILVALATAVALTLTKRYVYDTGSAIFFFNFFSLAMFSVPFIFEGMPHAGLLTLPSISAILYVGIVYNVIFAFAYYRALSILKTTVVTNFYFFVPFVTFVFSYLILGEAILPYYLIIAALVSAGILIQRFDKVGGTYATKRRELKDSTIFDVSGAFASTGEVTIVNTLKNGGRVLAIKLDAVHREKINETISSGGFANAFTDEHEGLRKESRFVREILGAKDNEIVVMKAGDTTDGERFLAGLLDRIQGSE